ncbi:hypothetical protein Forpe1208_v004176 [Fusarium oxysporum f. sp. rapae]|uniref:Uncharacterized protein n=1 Tax=Fusarium oxysporum f. sp. rapae TaxID=485398 RepID=A0A8J5U0A0_FUSOX|nr:hypothetical protein Forpe1208_v004176 [Fusarium oxysporum f. sp. rapae]
MSSSSQLVSSFRLASSIIVTLVAPSIRLSQFLVPSLSHLAPTPRTRNSEARQDDRDGRIPNVTRDVIVQIVDQLPHSIRYLQ